ncbi:MAG: VOC family protein [Candidatus Paracaedibacteraceae bacterium]|nr:VOC family protein [Candidatus Paracaedibacteraceae bacterium]
MSWWPAHFSQCSPCLVVKNVKNSIDFYTKAFGFKEHDGSSVDENGDIQHAVLQLGECTIMLFPEGAFNTAHRTPDTMKLPCPMALYIYVEDVDSLYKQATAAGAKSFFEPADAFWGDRFCKVYDLDGYEWSFATHQESAHQKHVQEKRK